MRNKSYSINISNKIENFNKNILVDSDKSISIRSFLISSISQNVSTIKNVLESDDVFSAIKCLKELGVKIIKKKSKNYLVFGKGLGSLRAKKNQIVNCGNSGTLARLLIGILSTTPKIDIKILGDHSLNKRNMSKLISLMNEFGAEFYPKKKTFPLRMVSSEMPVGMDLYKANVSAQLKSAVIFAGLNSFGTTKIEEDKFKSRDHTENMLSKNLNAIKIKKGKKKIIEIFGKNGLQSFDINVPADPSSAAFFVALTLLQKNSSLKIKNVGLNPTRIGFYEILKKNGAKIKFKNVKKIDNEIVGDIFVKSSKLRPLKVTKEFYVKSTDEYPIMFVIAGLTPGISVFEGIKDLANKESDRIMEMKKLLSQVGIKCISSESEMKIYGQKNLKKTYNSIKVPKLGDHRICMSAAILSFCTGIKAKINSFETVDTSSPSFLKIIKSLGGKFEIK